MIKNIFTKTGSREQAWVDALPFNDDTIWSLKAQKWEALVATLEYGLWSPETKIKAKIGGNKIHEIPLIEYWFAIHDDTWQTFLRKIPLAYPSLDKEVVLSAFIAGGVRANNTQPSWSIKYREVLSNWVGDYKDVWSSDEKVRSKLLRAAVIYDVPGAVSLLVKSGSQVKEVLHLAKSKEVMSMLLDGTLVLQKEKTLERLLNRGTKEFKSAKDRDEILKMLKAAIPKAQNKDCTNLESSDANDIVFSTLKNSHSLVDIKKIFRSRKDILKIVGPLKSGARGNAVMALLENKNILLEAVIDSEIIKDKNAWLVVDSKGHGTETYALKNNKLEAFNDLVKGDRSGIAKGCTTLTRKEVAEALIDTKPDKETFLALPINSGQMNKNAKDCFWTDMASLSISNPKWLASMLSTALDLKISSAVPTNKWMSHQSAMSNWPDSFDSFYTKEPPNWQVHCVKKEIVKLENGETNISNWVHEMENIRGTHEIWKQSGWKSLFAILSIKLMLVNEDEDGRTLKNNKLEEVIIDSISGGVDVDELFRRNGGLRRMNTSLKSTLGSVAVVSALEKLRLGKMANVSAKKTALPAAL